MTHLSVPEWGRVSVGDEGFSRGQANALLAAARTHPLGGPDGTDILCDHHSYLRARQMVGVLAGRDCSLEILPKVDPLEPDENAQRVRARLVHMLDVAFDLGVSVGLSAKMAHDADTLLEVFIAAFAERLLTEARGGMPRQYLAHEENLPALRGKLDARKQFTLNAVRPDRLACRFDALDSDIPLMQVMKACVVHVEHFARSIATRRKLAELRFLLDEVSDVPRGALPWREIRFDRASRRWRMLVELAQMLLGGKWQQSHRHFNAPEGITLLFPMNDLFESYIATLLRRELAGSGLEVAVQGGLRYALGPWTEGKDCEGTTHRTRPDILVRQGNEVVCVIDTKWKSFGEGIGQSDVYQMMAYARLYRCSNLILLYPATPGAAKPSEVRGLASGRERLDAVTLNLQNGQADVRRELRSIIGLPTDAGSGRNAQMNEASDSQNL